MWKIETNNTILLLTTKACLILLDIYNRERGLNPMRFWGRHAPYHEKSDNACSNNGLYLADADIGKTYTMLGLEGGQTFREKIYSMGLNPGVKFQILQNSGHGPVEIQVRQTKLALGRGMARQIKIRENGSLD